MMRRILDWIAKNPEKWIRYFNQEIERRLGNEDLGLPWSVRLHADRNIGFGTFKSLHRFYVLMAHLHALHRSRKPMEAYAKICQFLKVLE